MNRTPLIFVRHGETEWNRDLRFQGQRDIPLNQRGRRQAERNGRALAGILAAGHWRLISSPLGRSVETMRILLAAAGQKERSFDTHPALMEVMYGDWEGLTLEEIAALHPEETHAREMDKWGYAPPGGESYAMLAERVAGWLETVDEPTFIVAHGGTLRSLMHLLAGLPGHDAPYLAVPQERVVLFTREAVLTI
jgi:broad specificity phosphatase PhoE